MRCDSLQEALAATEPVTELWLGNKPVQLAGIEKLTSLQHVTLAALDDDACAHLTELPDLTTLQLNAAKAIPRAIEMLASLRAVKLVSCDALDLADALPKLATLATLHSLEITTHTFDMVRNVVQPSHVLPDVFDGFTQLQELTVMRGFHPFPPSIGSMTNLETLQIGVNAFDSIPKTIGKLQRLAVLDLTSTRITRLPDELCDCTQLRSLVLMNCRKLAELPSEIGRLARLSSLDIEFTAIKTLPASAARLTELRHFRASAKRAISVPDGFMADGADSLTGPPALLAKIAMRPTEVEGNDWVTIEDADRIPSSFGDPRTLVVSLRTYDKPLPQLGTLRSLEMANLEVLDLDAAFEHLAGSRNLRELAIRGDPGALPASLGKLRSLTHLTVWKQVETLPAELGELENLEELVVGSPVELPASIGKLAALRRIGLERGTRLPPELSGCTALAQISLGASTDAELAMLGALPALDDVSLHVPTNLDLAHFARPLAGRKLSRLRIEGDLEALPAELGAVEIQRLELQQSAITTLPTAAWPGLREVVVKTWRASKLKPSLPRGRWKKSEYSGDAIYRRS